MPRTTPKRSNRKPRKQTTKELLNAASKRKLSTLPQEQSPCAKRRRYSHPQTKRSPQLEGLADTQRYINQLKIQPHTGLDHNNEAALKETPDHKVGNLYVIFHVESSRWLAALLLPLNDLHRVGISETFESLGLSHNIPSCVTYDLDTSKLEWRDGFGDNEPLSHQRKFPIAYYLSDPDAPEGFNTQWIEAESLWELSSYGLELGEQSEPQAVAARLVSEVPRSLEQSAILDKLSKPTGISNSSSEIRGIYTGADTQQIPENTKLPGILQVASRWPLPLPDRVLRELAAKSTARPSSGPGDFRIPGTQEIYYCPLCSNKKRFQQVEIFINHLSEIH